MDRKEFTIKILHETITFPFMPLLPNTELLLNWLAIIFNSVFTDLGIVSVDPHIL
jgi:hypothetical protein